MDRSRINDILAEGADFFARHGWTPPPFAHWTPDEIRSAQGTLIRDRRLGWDITDYGQGRFDEMGLFLFTLRNGDLSEMGQQGAMLYAEKLMISRRDQLSPMHRHVLKTEDIINRGGATLVLELFTCDAEGQIDRKADVHVTSDGVAMTLPAGGHLKLPVGASVTLTPTTWHAFWGEGGDCLIHEVSTVNDDLTDNIFEMPIGRFSTLTEDVAPTHLLVSDY
ncbi:D-lyxose/D-mannose family sugar isomerase [uncultured Tateyamaria sp.]|uniref:D-lyxose/D-mannose family sugar isomerase n=1 Tax=uncultured Tateyamaria sp. TaxID=455651 RepID=UPI002602C062|nr:D-lyxose/D-mannose family sugar isomerase [uncultured Tateyamaria sp.]